MELVGKSTEAVVESPITILESGADWMENPVALPLFWANLRVRPDREGWFRM
jgi:hypothetical protein